MKSENIGFYLSGILLALSMYFDSFFLYLLTSITLFTIALIMLYKNRHTHKKYLWVLFVCISLVITYFTLDLNKL